MGKLVCSIDGKYCSLKSDLYGVV